MAAVDLDDPNLSEAEKDVIISNMMKEEAKVICDSDIKGWLFSIVCFSFCMNES